MAPHALIIPYPLQSHINPLMELSQKLASRGVAVTFVNTEYSHYRMMEALGCSGEEIGRGPDLQNIRFAQISDGLPLDFDRVSHQTEALRSLHNSGDALEELIRNADPPVSCVIASAFFIWTLDVAKKVDLPWVMFWPQSLTLFVMYSHLSDLISDPRFPPRIGETVDYNIPGLPPLQAEDLPSHLQTGDLSSRMHQLIWQQFELIHEADWVVGNTVDELEVEASDACKPRVCSVGPLFNPTKDSRTLSMWRESDCLPWLDSKPKSSVIYVSFGSMIRISARQLQEIAMGLLQSQQFFLWVLRPGIVEAASPETDILPKGFLERCKDRGLVVPWAPQVLVLSHPSVGGFFSHCGWNSTVESLSLGVPLLALPQSYDQYTNRMLIVKQWEIGMELKVRRDDGIVEVEEISRAVRTLVQSEEGRLARTRATVLSKAWTEGGSSLKNLQSFVDFIRSERTKERTCIN